MGQPGMGHSIYLLSYVIMKQLTSTPLRERIMVKRKFKTSKSGTFMKWWFVVRGDKSDVKLLEKIGLGFPTNKLEIGTSFPISDSIPHILS